MDRPLTKVLLILMSLLTLCACSTTATVTRTHDTYMTLWTKSLDSCRDEFIGRDRVIREETAKPILSQAGKFEDPWQKLTSRVFQLSIILREAYTIAGRGETTKAFIRHMQAHPSAGQSDLWFSRAGDAAKKELEQASMQTITLLASLDQKVRQGPDWILEMEALAKVQGLAIGKIRELQSLHGQAISYYKDMDAARLEDQRITMQRQQAVQSLLAAMAYLGQVNFQQQLINSLSRPRTCTVVGNMVTCY